MSKMILRILINAIALWVAAQLLSGIHLAEDAISILLVAVVFGLINALLKPIVTILSLPFIFVTLGLFTLVINAVLLLLTSSVTEGLSVDGFWPAVLGSVVISIVSMLLSMFLDDDKKKKQD
jgi:putative membrane protein